MKFQEFKFSAAQFDGIQEFISSHLNLDLKNLTFTSQSMCLLKKHLLLDYGSSDMHNNTGDVSTTSCRFPNFKIRL